MRYIFGKSVRSEKDRATIHDYVDNHVSVLEASDRAREAEYEGDHGGMTDPEHTKADCPARCRRTGRGDHGHMHRGNVPGRIEAAMMWTSELLDMMVLDQPKAHEGMQKHAMRRGVFVTLDGGRQIKAHEDMLKPDTGNRFKPHEGLTKPNMGTGDQGIPLRAPENSR